MEGTKISELPSASQINAGDVVAGVVNGNTSKIDVELLKGQKGDPGEAGPEGPQGPQGEPGKDGSDATVDIQQTTGTSTTAVMSQDATTRAVDAEAKARVDAISAETTAREAAVSAEAEARTEAIGAETTARTKAIQALQTQVQADLQNYYTKTQTDQMISAIPKFAIQPVDSLPTENISDTTVYLLKTGEDSQNLYTEYIHVNNVWEELGTQAVDLTDYYTKTEADNQFATKTSLNSLSQTVEEVQTGLGNVYTKTESNNLYVPKTTTVNGKALSSDITIPIPSVVNATGTSTTAAISQKAATDALNTKQATLVGSGSGQNIKTVGGTSILGSGNISLPTPPSVVQTTGTSTTSVMSQKAVSDELVTKPTISLSITQYINVSFDGDKATIPLGNYPEGFKTGGNKIGLLRLPVKPNDGATGITYLYRASISYPNPSSSNPDRLATFATLYLELDQSTRNNAVKYVYGMYPISRAGTSDISGKSLIVVVESVGTIYNSQVAFAGDIGLAIIDLD